MRSAVATRHTLERPWTEKYWNDNPVSKVGNGMAKPVPVVEPIREKDWMWFRGDRVEILTGPDKGKQGYINMIVQVLKTTGIKENGISIPIYSQLYYD